MCPRLPRTASARCARKPHSESRCLPRLPRLALPVRGRPVLFVSPISVRPLSLPSARPSNILTSVSFQSLTSIKFCNSFVLIFIQNARGCVRTPLLPILEPSRHSSLATRHRIQVLSFHTLAHSFALTQNTTLLFSSDSALFAQNTRGGRGGCQFLSSATRLPLATRHFLSAGSVSCR
jgi:hypothetical protein